MINIVIKNLNPEHGKKILKYFQSLGVDTTGYSGTVSKDIKSSYIYYGVINGQFRNYSKPQVISRGATIIQLPEDTLPKRGDRILVGDKDDWVERIFLTHIEGAYYPIVTASGPYDTEAVKSNTGFETTLWKYWKPLPEELTVELTLQDISDGKGVGVPSHLIRIKK